MNDGVFVNQSERTRYRLWPFNLLLWTVLSNLNSIIILT